MLNIGIFMTNQYFREFLSQCQNSWPDDPDVNKIIEELSYKHISSNFIIKIGLTGNICFFNVAPSKDEDYITWQCDWNSNTPFTSLLREMLQQFYNVTNW